VDIETVEVPKITSHKLLQDRHEKIDVLSIDVEGAEFDVLASYDWDRDRPEVILIEDNSQGKDRTVEQFLLDKNYTVLTRIGCNIVFCDKL